jgi:hypothetical protein
MPRGFGERFPGKQSPIAPVGGRDRHARFERFLSSQCKAPTGREPTRMLDGESERAA